jgi:hypothetical protein
MEMLLMGACLGLFGLAVSCLAFRAALPDEERAVAMQPELAKAAAVAVSAPRFFAEPVTIPMAAHARVPIEALLLQIENHIRLEQAAAESFLATPTATMLHSRTMSPLVN